MVQVTWSICFLDIESRILRHLHLFHFMLNELCMNGWYVSFQGLVVMSYQLTKRWNMGTGFEMARRLVGFFW